MIPTDDNNILITGVSILVKVALTIRPGEGKLVNLSLFREDEELTNRFDWSKRIESRSEILIPLVQLCESKELVLYCWTIQNEICRLTMDGEYVFINTPSIQGMILTHDLESAIWKMFDRFSTLID